MVKAVKKLFSGDRTFYMKVLAMALPIALQSLVTIGVNMLDTIMVGRLGEEALSASSLANQFINIYHIFCMGIGMGASVLVSRYWGMKTKEEDRASEALKKTICIMTRLTLSLALLFAVVTLVIPGTVMKMYTTEGSIISLGMIYFRYSVVTYFFLGMSLVCTIVLRSVGQVRMPLYVSIGAFGVNFVANYALIFGKLGIPRLGIAGAALGTLIARVFEAGIICGYLFFIDKAIGFRLKHLFMRTGDLVGEYIRISIPVLVSDGILAIGNNTVVMVIGHLGVAFVAANAVTSVTQQMSNVLTQGVSQAGAIVTGQTLGEGGREKALNQGYAFLGLGLCLGLFAAAVIRLISGPVIHAYEMSPETVEIAGQLMDAIGMIMIFQSANSIMTKGVLRGGGDTKVLMLADNIFLWLLSIPLGIAAGFALKLPAFWIYTCLKIDQVAKAVWCVFRLRGGKWIKKISTGRN